ncbi:hypothetical protein [Halovenus salina]|uniref:Halobacterial output domain-containing protein n=1 Tax=Halovenus salina TaxID=1510225 RepID=A0ABD5W655_9EURY
MSIQDTTPNGKEFTGVSVSDHAAQRYLERVDGSEPFPRSAIRSAFAKGEHTVLDDNRFADPAMIHDGIAFIFDDREREVITVVELLRDQAADVRLEADASAGWGRSGVTKA